MYLKRREWYLCDSDRERWYACVCEIEEERQNLQAIEYSTCFLEHACMLLDAIVLHGEFENRRNG